MVISHVSEVDVCAGMTSRVINRALDFKIPQRMPHVSRLRRVFEVAAFRKRERSCEGRKMVRRGSPFSRYAEGLKVNSSRSVGGVAGRAVSGSLLGTGGADVGASTYLPGIGGGRGCSKSNGSAGGLGGFGGRAGGNGELSEGLRRSSLGGLAGALP